jgi:hypothetical protein
MSAMQLLPDLCVSLVSDLVHVIGSCVAESSRSHVVFNLTALSHSELANLKAGFARWLAGMKPERMVRWYTLVRKLILVVEQIYGEDPCP